MNLPPYVYQGSFVFVTLALRREAGDISAVPIKNICSDSIKT